MKKIKVHTIILDTSSDTSPSAPSLSSSTESRITTTTQTRNVTPVTPSKRTRSQIKNTSSLSSSSTTSRPPITEIHITTRSQPSPFNTPLVHISNPESVERYVSYKHPTAVKNVRLQPQLNIVHVPDTEYTQLPPLQLPSEISKNSSKINPPLKPLGKLSASLSNLLDITFDYLPSQESTSLLFVPHHRYNLGNLSSRRLSIDTSTFNVFALSRLHAQIHNLQNLILTHILPLVLKPLHYYLRMLKLQSFQEIFSLKV